MKRAAPFVVIAGVLAVAFAWYMLWWGPTGDDITRTASAASAAKTERTQLEAQLSRLTKLQGRTKEIEAKAEALRGRIPNEATLDSFIIEANVIATKNGVEWVSITPTQPSANGPGGLSTIGFTMELQGSYPQIRSYLEAIMNADRLVVLDSVSLQASAASSASAAAAPVPDGSAGTSAALRVSITGRMFTAASAGATGTAGTSAGSGGGANAPGATPSGGGSTGATGGSTGGPAPIGNPNGVGNT